MGLFSELQAENQAGRDQRQAIDEIAEHYDGASLSQILKSNGDQERLAALGFERPYYPQVALNDQDNVAFFWHGWANHQGQLPLLLARLQKTDWRANQHPKLVMAKWSYGLLCVEFIDSDQINLAALEATETAEQIQSVGLTMLKLEEIFSPDFARLEALREYRQATSIDKTAV
ncbi:MAG: hypothetical protein ABIQ89_02730 [Candidatus Saccharimonadales bacterium]